MKLSLLGIFISSGSREGDGVTESLRSHCQNHCLMNLENNGLEQSSDSVTPNMNYRNQRNSNQHPYTPCSKQVCASIGSNSNSESLSHFSCVHIGNERLGRVTPPRCSDSLESLPLLPLVNSRKHHRRLRVL